jgi:hypothetical protein
MKSGGGPGATGCHSPRAKCNGRHGIRVHTSNICPFRAEPMDIDVPELNQKSARRSSYVAAFYGFVVLVRRTFPL